VWKRLKIPCLKRAIASHSTSFDITTGIRRAILDLRLLFLKTKQEGIDKGNALSDLKRYEEAIRLDPNDTAYTGKSNALHNLKRDE
jgi:hypothetical protein